MILGIGNDLVDIRRIEQTLERFGERFIHRVFTRAEIAKATRRAQATRHHAAAATYAKRFAAKEACAKALGTGIRMGTHWRSMEIVNLPTGQPTLRLHGKAAARLAAMTPPGLTAHISVTLTDEYPLAEAIVIIEAQ